MIGRKKVYGVEALIMAVGAILTALSPNFAWLLVTRFSPPPHSAPTYPSI